MTNALSSSSGDSRNSKGSTTSCVGNWQKARSDQWQARLDDLDLQAHLGAMDAQETLDPLVERLRNAWLDARQRFDSGTSTASDVIDQLRDGFEQAR